MRGVDLLLLLPAGLIWAAGAAAWVLAVSVGWPQRITKMRQAWLAPVWPLGLAWLLIEDRREARARKAVRDQFRAAFDTELSEAAVGPLVARLRRGGAL